jgi:hypothetical protein
MASDSETVASASEAWSTTDLPAVDSECDFVCESNGLSVAGLAA